MKILILILIWIILFSLSFVIPRLIEPNGDGFTRGLNRLPAVIGLQGLGFLVAVLAAILSYRSRAGIKKWLLVAGFVPVVVDLLLGMLLLLLLLGAIVGG